MWYGNCGKDNDVAVSSRVRLARNISGYPFGKRLTSEQENEICEKVGGIFKSLDDWTVTDFGSLPLTERHALCEKHLVSREFANKKGAATLVSDKNNDVSVMVLEEDHLRIQAICGGLDLRGALLKAYETEELIDGGIEYAYSEKYGYLTQCPTNLGTGMRASVMLYLPAYTKAGGVRNLALQLAKLGLTIRGMEGEGSFASAYLYQISNQVTLGITEEEILTRLESVIEQIITGECALREKMNKQAIREKARRQYGMLMYSEAVSAKETTEIYSDLRLASAMGLVNIPSHKLDEMLVRCMPNSISADNGGAATPEERDSARAKTVRDIIGGLEI